MSIKSITSIAGFGNTNFDFTSSEGLFSFASIQQGKILHKYVGNTDLMSLAVLWYVACASDTISMVDIRNNLSITATRMTRCLKQLKSLDLINISIDNQDARHRLLSLTDKGKALKLDLINTLSENK